MPYFDNAMNVLNRVLAEQRERQTPGYQMQIEELINMRLQRAQEQEYLSKLSNASSVDEMMEAIKTKNPGAYLNYRVSKEREERLKNEIVELGSKGWTTEEKLRYNLLSGSNAFDIPKMTKEEFEEQERFKTNEEIRKEKAIKNIPSTVIHKTDSGGEPTPTSRESTIRQREREIMDNLPKIVSFENNKPTRFEEQVIKQYYMANGVLPEGWTLKREEEADRKMLENSTIMLISEKDSWLKIPGKYKRTEFLEGTPEPEDYRETLNEMLKLSDTEIDNLKIKSDLKKSLKQLKSLSTIQPKEYETGVSKEAMPDGFETTIDGIKVKWDKASQRFIEVL